LALYGGEFEAEKGVSGRKKEGKRRRNLLRGALSLRGNLEFNVG
jgi:hypothetical protein